MKQKQNNNKNIPEKKNRLVYAKETRCLLNIFM